MARAKREKTRYPGIYRRGDRIEYIWRDANGQQRSATARTMEIARREKARMEDEARTGHAQDTQLTLAEYARDWVDRYQGRTNRGFRESTREAYRRELETYVIPFFGDRQRIAAVTPRRVSAFVSHLLTQPARPLNAIESRRPPADEPRPTLSDASIRRIMAPLKACMADAVQEGVIQRNPTLGVRLPTRPRVEEDDEGQAKALTDAELDALLRCAPERHRDLLQLLAVAGPRISEAIALSWRHLTLTGDRPVMKVRRAYVKGEFQPPKSKHGRRDVPLPHDVVRALRRRKRAAARSGPDDLVFAMDDGTPWSVSNLRRQAIEPAASEAGVPWAGFHTLRHTCATRLFAAGRNAVQVQRWLGHHSPAFTLATYVHLLNDDLGGPLELPDPSGDSMGTAEAPEITGNGDAADHRIASPGRAI